MNTLYTGIVCPDTTFVHMPLIEIHPVADNDRLLVAESEIENYDYLLYTSRHAVTYFPPKCAHPTIVSIGSTTTEALRLAGAKTIKQVEKDDSYGVVDWFSRLKRGRVLIPRSNLALNIIPEGLRNLGYEVTTVTAYENRMPENIEKVDLDQIDTIIFTSPSTIDNFIRLYGYLPADKQLLTRGRITEKHLQSKMKETPSACQIKNTNSKTKQQDI